MTVAEIIEMQRKKCEADKLARLAKLKRHSTTIRPVSPEPVTARMTPADRERAYIADRTYDGKIPEGGMRSIMRKESPEEYVSRDGTKTFVPWRYVSMQDLELPDNGNPYRRPNPDENGRKPTDPWGRPSGYVGSAAGQGISPEYDPWSISGTSSSTQGGGWDWLSPSPAQPAIQNEQVPAQQGDWNSSIAPPPGEVPTSPAELPEQMPAVDTDGTLDIMRSMRR